MAEGLIDPASVQATSRFSDGQAQGLCTRAKERRSHALSNAALAGVTSRVLGLVACLLCWASFSFAHASDEQPLANVPTYAVNADAQLKAAIDAIGRERQQFKDASAGILSKFESVHRVLPYASNDLRSNYLLEYLSIAVLNGDAPSADRLIEEQHRLTRQGVGRPWQPPEHFEITTRYWQAHHNNVAGRYDESRAQMVLLFNDVLTDLQLKRPDARARLRFLFVTISGQRIWHTETAALSEKVAEHLGAFDELSIRALLAGSFSLRVVGQYDRAERMTQRAHDWAHAYQGPGAERVRASAASQHGLVLMGQGKYVEAKPFVEFARDETTRLSNRTEISRPWIWLSSGHLYSQLGEYDLAIQNYERAIELYKEIVDAKGKPYYDSINIYLTNHWIAQVHALAGRPKQALAVFDETMRIDRMWTSMDPWVHAAFPVIAQVLADAGRFVEATQLLDLARRGALHSHGSESASIAQLDAALGALQVAQSRADSGRSASAPPNDSASQHFAAALAIQLHDPNSMAMANIWFAIGHALDQGQTTHIGSLLAYKLGASSLAGARQRATAQDTGVIAVGGYLPTLQRLVDLLLREQRFLEAEEVQLQLGREEQIAFARRSPLRRSGGLIERANTVSAVKTHEQFALPLTKSESAVLPQLQTATDQSAAHRRMVVAGQALYFNGDSLARGATATFPPGWHDTVAQTRDRATQLISSIDRMPRAVANADVLNEGRVGALTEPGVSAVVRYVISDKLVAWVSTPDRSVVIALTATTAELTRAAAQFRTAIRRPDFDAMPSSQALWNMLIAPVWAQVPQMREGRVRFEVNGLLRYIPIASLHDGEKYLAERVVVIQGERAMPQRPDESHPLTSGRLALIGAAKHDTMPELAHVSSELAAVNAVWASKFASNTQTLAKTSLDGGRADLLQAIRDKPDVLHIAAHFRFKPGSETQSALLLTGRDRLHVGELREEDFSSIRLVTLSACDSALDFAEGIEVSGLSRTLIDKGAQSVLGTLWAVSDPATAQWMTKFYATWQGSSAGFAKADAIAEVQRDFVLARGVSKDWAHPYYWAGYVLAGQP